MRSSGANHPVDSPYNHTHTHTQKKNPLYKYVYNILPMQSFDHKLMLKPVLNWAKVCLPNIFRTV